MLIRYKSSLNAQWAIALLDAPIYFSLQNSLNDKTFANDDAKSHLVQFFTDKDQKFYKRGIIKLLERWQKTIEQNGKYIIDWSLFFALKKKRILFHYKTEMNFISLQNRNYFLVNLIVVKKWSIHIIIIYLSSEIMYILQRAK